MKRLETALLALVILLLSACGGTNAGAPPSPSPSAQTEQPQGEEDAIVCFQTALTPAPSEEPLPTLPPAITPVPTPEPKITDEWYRQRNEGLVALLLNNGACATEDEANARVQAMQIDPDKPMVALTFDDGPTHGVTDTILDVLEKYNGRATFFIVGQRLSGSESLIRRAVTLGCEIGSHTWEHSDLTTLSTERAMESVQKTIDAVAQASGYTIASLRPPKGNSNDNVKAIAKKMGLALVFWNHSTHDYRLDSPERIYENVFYDKEDKKALEDGDIILLHDLRKPTAQAIEDIVKRLTEEGYQLVTVQELLQCSDSGFHAGGSYRRKG